MIGGRTTMATTSKRVLIFFVIVAILSLPATSQASEKVLSYTYPIQATTYFGICPPEGEGEGVAFEGTGHVVLREDVFTPGGIHQNYHDNLMDLRGTGMTTGNLYRFVGVFNLHTNVSQSGESAWEYEITQIGKIVSQGSGDNEYQHAVTKLTVGPNGITHAEFQFVREGCEG